MNTSKARGHQRESVVKMACDIERNIPGSKAEDKAAAIAAHILRYWPQSLVQLLLDEADKQGTELPATFTAVTPLLKKRA